MRRYFFGVWLLAVAPAKAVQLVEVCGQFKKPVYATALPSRPQTLFVVEQSGKILTCDEKSKVHSEFLNIEKQVTSGGEMGLLGLAFHPQYEKNQRYFLYYSVEKPERVNRVVERKAGSNEEKLLLSVRQPFSNHDGGGLAFDAKGLLYIGKGDGGAGYDPYGNGQNRDSLLGKILRIDVDRAEGKRPYGIPKDNPFPTGPAPEVFAWGLRNPWRFSFDPKTNWLWVGDVGQDRWEEIDIVENGKNYGWREREGKHCSPQIPQCQIAGLEDPIWEYDHSQGVSITGGYVYRGKKIPALEGLYIYADYDSGRIWGLRWDEKTRKALNNQELLKTKYLISSFGEDAAGELLLVDHRGSVYRLVP